jgi:hypothetical protein
METNIRVQQSIIDLDGKIKLVIIFLIFIIFLIAGLLIRDIYQERAEQENYLFMLKSANISDEKREALEKKAILKWNNQKWHQKVTKAAKEGYQNSFNSYIICIDILDDWQKYSDFAKNLAKKHKLNDNKLKDAISQRMDEKEGRKIKN